MGDNTLRQLYDSKGIEPVIIMLPPSSNSKILKAPPVDNLAKDYDSDESGSSTPALIIYGVSTDTIS